MIGLCLGAILTAACAMAARVEARTAPGGEGEDRASFRGTVGLYAKYNSNLELTESWGGKLEDAFIGEPAADLRLTKTWGPDWWLDLEFSGQADFHAGHTEENWYFNRGRFSLVRALGEDAISLSSEVRHFTTPGRDQFDFFRHAGLLSYKKTLSALWQVRIGYDNILTRYPRSRSFNYAMNGFFAEVRNTWSLGFSTYYSYDFQAYRGSFDPLENNPNASPDEGTRHTGEIGFDWLVSSAQTLSGTYLVQSDVSEVGVRQIGEFEGREESQDLEAEFDLGKHKATLLYSHRLNRRLLLSSYVEWLHKGFDSEDDPPAPRMRRTDTLWLSSTHLKFNWSEELAFKIRYLFRANQSSLASQDYRDHILFLGPECRF